MSGLFSLHMDHVEIFVPSRFEAADWYRRTLGLHAVDELLEWAGDPEGPLMIAPASGTPMLALFTGPAQGTHAQSGLARVAFRTDAQGFLKFLEHLITQPVYDAEGALTTEPHIVDHQQAISAYFSDPYGTPLEVTTYEPQPVRRRLGMRPEQMEL